MFATKLKRIDMAEQDKRYDIVEISGSENVANIAVNLARKVQEYFFVKNRHYISEIFK